MNPEYILILYMIALGIFLRMTMSKIVIFLRKKYEHNKVVQFLKKVKYASILFIVVSINLLILFSFLFFHLSGNELVNISILISSIGITFLIPSASILQRLSDIS